MIKLRDGGPAFPLFFPESKTRDGKVTRAHDEHPGMSLRDYFAAQVLSVLNYHNILNNSMCDEDAALQIVNAAALSYRLADALLAERAK